MSHSLVGIGSRRNGPSAAWLFIATASGSRSQLGQLATGLRRRPLTLGDGPASRHCPESGRIAGTGSGLDASREPLKKPLQRLSTRATSRPDLDSFEDDSPATVRCPAVERRDVALSAPSASGEFIGRL